jgi:formate dehydrogenase maturation protein FdhE
MTVTCCSNCGSNKIDTHEVQVDQSGETVVVAWSCRKCQEVFP